MLRKYVGRGFSVAANTIQFAYAQITQEEEQQPVRDAEPQLAGDNNGVHYGSFDVTSQQSTANTIRAAENHKGVDTQPLLNSPGPSAQMPQPVDDVELTTINENEELVNVQYRTLIWLHSVTPFSVLAYLAILAAVILRYLPTPQDPFSSSIMVPFSTVLVGGGAWIVAQSFKQPIHDLVSLLVRSKKLQSLLSLVLHTLALDLTRWQALLLAVPALRDSTGDHSTASFTGLSWFAFGWLATLLTVTTVQQFSTLALYKDLLPLDRLLLPLVDDSDHSTETASSASLPPDNLEHQLNVLNGMRKRNDVCVAYGQPFPNIPLPGFLFPLWRLDTLLLGTGLTLILGAHPGWTTYLIIAAIDSALALFWRLLLPRVGLGGLTYMSFMCATAVFLCGLNRFGIV